MKLFQDSERQLFFDRISEFSPGSIEEYNKLYGSALAEVAEVFGMAKVVCSVSAPRETAYAEMVPGEMILFNSEGEAEAQPVCFHYPLETDGAVEFSVFMDKGVNLTPEEERELEVIFRQLFNVFDAFLLRISCRKLIMTDNSTGIPNLKAFQQFCGMLIARERLDQYTALYFNIRNFRSVYKALTYLEGNEVMGKYCRSVAGAVTREEIVARLGSDNFVALIINENVDRFLKYIQSMRIGYEKDGRKLNFRFGATVGAAELSEEKNPGEVMLRISTAYQSAREHNVPLSYYDNGIGNEIRERKNVLSRFDEALKDGEFYIVYQPKVGVKNHAVLGAEALARWNRSDRYAMPANFVPVLERDGRITRLDFYVLEEVCKFLKKMQSDGLEPVRISVNFSKRHLTNDRLAQEIVEMVDRYEVPHGYIKIELTESEDYRNHNIMRDIVEKLDAQGIKTAIDDFGTGNSSLSMLNTLQMDELKIDRSLIPQGDVDDKDKGLLMLKGVMNLAKSLGFTIVAEGVETQEQLELIENMGCDVVQGYIFDKPLSESEFIEKIRQKQYDLNA